MFARARDGWNRLSSAAMRWRTVAGTLAAAGACALGAAPGAAADEFGDYAAVRGDWQPDGAITACRFTVEQLENAKAAMTGEDEYSGLQGALEREIVRHRTGGCPGGGGHEGAAVVSRARFVPARFRATRGATLRFALSRRATVRIVVERRRGRRWSRVATLVRSSRRAGNNSLRLRARGLAPGLHRATLTALSPGRRARPARAAFRILPG